MPNKTLHHEHGNSSSPIFSKSQSEWILISWLMAFEVVAALTFLSNLATILTFVINRHLRRRSVYCLINLAVADMIFGLLTVFWSIESFGQNFGTLPKEIRQTRAILNEVIFCMIMLCLIVVALERFYATFFPFRHRTTELRSYIVVFVVTWLFGVVMSLFSLVRNPSKVDFNALRVFAFIACIAALSVIAASYAAVFIKVKMQNQQHVQQQQENATLQRQKQEYHMAVTLFIVTFLSFMTWIPAGIVNYVLKLDAVKQTVPYNVEQFSLLILVTNSLINPIVYVFRLSDFRRALFRLVCRCSRDRPNRIQPTNNQPR